MPCCSCKRAGTCQRCARFTSGVSCSDCYPSWDNRYKNGGNTASASMSSSSNGSCTRSARSLFQGNQEQSRRITNNMADFAQVSLRSHSQPVPVSSDVSSTLSGRTSTLSQPVVSTKGSSDQQTSANRRTFPSRPRAPQVESTRSESAATALTFANRSSVEAAGNQHDTMAFPASGAQTDVREPENANALFVAETFISGSTDDTTVERLPDGNDVDVRVRALPEFVPASSPAFSWGDAHGGEEFLQQVKSAYLEVVQWRPNIFAIPLGAAGKKFVEESTRLVQAFAEGSALESVSFLALMLMPSLLLQQPTGQPSHRQRTDCLQRRLLLWAAGNIGELLLEGRVIQADLPRRLNRKRYDPSEGMSRAFSRLMIQGKVKAALRLLSTQSRGEVLAPDAILPGGDNAEASPRPSWMC